MILVGIDDTIEPDSHQTDPMSNGGAKLQSPSVITRQIEFLMPPEASRGLQRHPEASRGITT